MDTPNFQLYNPWKLTGFRVEDLPESSLKPRFVFPNLKQAFYESNLMIFIKGLRRLGKSTLIRQIIIDLLRRSTDPSQINYVQFSQSFSDLDGVLRQTPPNSFLFLDEIQYCRHWRDTLKQYYDANTSTKICFTGSAVLNITHEKESLAGRFLPITVWPLTFSEYLYLKYTSPPRRALEDFSEYLSFGEFPETLKLSSPDIKTAYFKDSIVEPVLTIDIPQYGLEKKQEFAAFLRVLAANTAQILNKSNLAAETGLSRPSVNRFLSILNDMGLIRLLPNYLPSVRSQILSDKKVLFTSTNIVLSLLNISQPLSFPQIKGQILETYSYNQLRHLFSQMWYWRKQQKELDFMGISNDQLSAFEIKSTDKINTAEINMYRRYASKLNSSFELIYSGKTNPTQSLKNLTEI
ncbi:MAG: ATPase [Microgenomates group bacterium Gr01-1014_16]|nr:MAG: ATPase [Microgenomates group bacterium Gr01-1014_16]